MVYIASDGSLADTKKRKWGLSIIRDFIVGIFDFIGLFFRTLTASPTTLENERVSVFFLLYHYYVSMITFFSYLIHCFLRMITIYIVV
jgi:hypothetical protein